MLNSIHSTIQLNNGVVMPRLGLGVFRVEPQDTINAVLYALEAGYRSVDTAAVYGNEAEVGEAVKQSGIDRGELFITTKVWNDDQGYDSTLRAFESSMKKLRLDYLDLYLVHWPGRNRFVETYRAMEELYREGRIRAIGVSNFNIRHLETLLEQTEVVPVINQVELHPFCVQPTLREWCQAQGIAVEAWRPILQGEVGEHPVIAKIAEAHGKTPVQVTLRWHLQHDVVVIPKSIHKERIVSNADIWDFSLSDEEMRAIDALDAGKRTGPDPEEFLF